MFCLILFTHSRYFTFHFCSPAETFGCMVSSRRSAPVVTGLNVTLLNLSFSTPYGPRFSTGFQSSPSLYTRRHEAGTRTPPRPVSSNQYSSLSATVTGFSKVYCTHSFEPLVGQKSK